MAKFDEKLQRVLSDNTRAERAVLDASAKAPESELRLVISLPGHPSWEVEHARAELRRRGIKV